MSFLVNAFHIILYQPFLNILVLLYEYLPGRDFGIAVIALTVVIRLVLYPLMAQSIRYQKIMSELQPKMQEIQQKYKDNREAQTREMMALYQKEKINPFSSLLPLLIQLPILIALYQVFWKGLQPEALNDLYRFIPNPGTIDPAFLGVINLGSPSLILAVLAGIAQFFQTKMMSSQNPVKGEKQKGSSQFSAMMQKQMLYFFPIFTVFILWKLPSAIGLYWVVTSLFSILQQRLVFKKEHAESN